MLTVPESLEGWCLLHQMFTVSWPDLAQAGADDRAELAASLRGWLEASATADGSSIAVAMLGHKADLMLVHARRSFDDLVQAQLDVARLPLAEVLDATTSYVSIVELGMYEMTAKVHEQLTARGIAQDSEEYRPAMKEAMLAQQPRIAGRLFMPFPHAGHVGV